MSAHVCLGCSHGRHHQLKVPNGQVLIHTGDYSRRGDRSDAIDFLKWLEARPHKHRLFCDGNHDGHSQEHPDDFAALVKQYAPSCHYLNGTGIELDGIKYFGSSWSPAFMDWWWNAERGPVIAAHWAKIPDDTHVLITHGPPRGHLDLIVPGLFSGPDLHEGCDDLRDTINLRLSKLLLSCFSHLHFQGCQQESMNGIVYVNAAVVDDGYSIRGDIQIVDINP